MPARPPGLRPLKGRTWGRRGRTPVVKVTAQGSKRVSIAALIATRPGTAGRAQLIYRTHLDRGSGKHRHKGFTETDYARLLDSAHQQLHGPIVLVWDNLPTHVSRAMRQLIAKFLNAMISAKPGPVRRAGRGAGGGRRGWRRRPFGSNVSNGFPDRSIVCFNR